MTDSPRFDQEIRALLAPLQQGNITVDYRNQYKAAAEFLGRLRSLELQYTDLYSQVTQLENKIAQDF